MGKRVTIRHNKDGSRTRPTTYSYKNAFGTRKTHTYVQKEKGCYVATCVYGSYDCPEVWTLRRYRDNKLAKSVLGRAFIRCYYAVSPTVVKIFGKTKLFQNFWRARLDRMVQRLNAQGFSSERYQD